MSQKTDFARRDFILAATGVASLPIIGSQILATEEEVAVLEMEKDAARVNALRPMSSHNNLHALLFQATSAEYIALCVQAYQLARHTIVERLAEKDSRNPAVVLDLDETILDNSAYQAWQIQTGTNFDEKTSWRSWCNLGQASAVPGSIEFVRYAVSQGVTPLFITSRENVTRRGTVENLVKLGLLTKEEQIREIRDGDTAENANQTRLFMKGMPSIKLEIPSGEQEFDLGNKFLQRIFCEQVRDYEIILSVGDNLADYAEYYSRVVDATGQSLRGQHPTPASRRIAVLQDQPLFGRDFVLIPNVTYGGWLRAFEGNGLGAPDELAQTTDPVRESLKEPQDPFIFGNPPTTVSAKGPKFSHDNLRIWKGPVT